MRLLRIFICPAFQINKRLAGVMAPTHWNQNLRSAEFRKTAAKLRPSDPLFPKSTKQLRYATDQGIQSNGPGIAFLRRVFLSWMSSFRSAR
jgi:hypothetical protein